MNILVTGAKGMVGTALVNNLKNIRDNKNRTRPNIQIDEIYEYDVDGTTEELDEYCKKADFVFNLAGVNRPTNPEDFMKGNYDFASRIIDALKKYNNKAPIMLSSSIQATLSGRFGDSEYGRSKKAGEELFFQYGEENGVKVAVYRFPNLMGHSRPKYNSAVSTFCWAMANDEEFTINDRSTELELLYIDDLVEGMYDLLEGKEQHCEFDGIETVHKDDIMRIPGEGTDQLIDRKHEADVFNKISGLGFCDDPVYINPQNGYKITKFLDGVRVADSENTDDLYKCMSKLKAFHSMRLQVEHTFDIFGQIEFYESLWSGSPSVYRDYLRTKNNVFSLKEYIESQPKDWCLTHIDAVPDNFLFYTDSSGSESLQLTDWEYSGMQDPHVDIAMFIIYCLYNKKQADNLIDIYFDNKCDNSTRAKIYCYIAACGLLWSNWCEFKSKLGIEFGEYGISQYRYAKDFYKLAVELIEGEKSNG